MQKYITKAKEFGATTAFLVDFNDLVFDDRTVMQCRTCKRYGTKATCPPNIPPNTWFKGMLEKYKFKPLMVILTYKTTDDNWRELSAKNLHEIMLKLEHETKIDGFYYSLAFIGGSCRYCRKCSGPICVHPEFGRIPVEATGIDVIATCKKNDIQLEMPPKDNISRVGVLFYG